MKEKQPFKIYSSPELVNSSLVVGWNEDAGKLGSKVIDYLRKKLGGEEFAEIDPVDFFPLGGVYVEYNVAQFPESKFYYCRHKNLVLFESSSPRSGWYKFMNSVLDVAEYCHSKELYTLGGMVSLSAHTMSRELLAVANSQEMKALLDRFGSARDVDYETPPGQRPTLSTYLLWVAKRRNIDGASLWVPVPFYLVAAEDPSAGRKALQFLDNRFGLGLDYGELDEEVSRQNEKIDQARARFPEIHDYIQKLESNLGLTQEENEKLAKEIEELFRKKY